MKFDLETLVFLIHSVKQLCFGFETLNEHADEWEDGSASKAFFLTAIYNHLAVFYLLDRGANDPMGGSFYKALQPLGAEHHLDRIRSVIEAPIGLTTFGEIVRVFRNKAIVHTNYKDTDLERIYRLADMTDPMISQQFSVSLWRSYAESKTLALRLIEEAGHSPAQFGFH